MILTGKTKEDFIQYLSNKQTHSLSFIFDEPKEIDYNIESLPIEWLNALIIEFFDSIRIGNISIWLFCFHFDDLNKRDWREHIDLAIKQANMLYNEKINRAEI